MYQMMYKTEGLSPTYMDVCKTKESKDEFLKNRELLARGMVFHFTLLTNIFKYSAFSLF